MSLLAHLEVGAPGEGWAVENREQEKRRLSRAACRRWRTVGSTSGSTARRNFNCNFSLRYRARSATTKCLQWQTPALALRSYHPEHNTE